MSTKQENSVVKEYRIYTEYRDDITWFDKIEDDRIIPNPENRLYLHHDIFHVVDGRRYLELVFDPIFSSFKEEDLEKIMYLCNNTTDPEYNEAVFYSELITENY